MKGSSTEKRQGRILIIDDNQPDVDLIQEALAQHGVEGELEVLDDGYRTLTWRDRILKGESEIPALVILDLNLPGYGGLELLAAMRQVPTLAKTPIVIFTSSNSPSERLHAEAIGATAFLRKPTALGEFLAIGARFKELMSEPAGRVA
jgi:CheY-like chemotaxis protein